MKNIQKYLVLIALCLVGGAMCMAEDVSFRASAPSQVIVGRPFQLTYTVNQRAKDLRAPEFVHFDHLAGPFTSQSSSTSFVNGHRSSTFTLTYTYTLVAQEEGTFTLAPATITVGKEEYSSNGVKITVLPPDEEPQQRQQSQQQGQRQRQSQPQQQGQVSGDNLFIRTIVTKSTLYEQEVLTLSYKLYFADVDVAQFTNNTHIPDFKGFLKQELDMGDIQTELEHYNGRNYQTAVLYRTLLYPQHSGDIEIEPASFEAVLRVRNRAQVRSIFDDFFDSYTNVTRAIKAPGVTIHAKALPSGKPAGYSGGVGQFNLKSSISQTSLQANEAVTIKMEISGTGNMKLLKTPAIDWPEGFEAYDPKITNNFKTTASGVSGTKTIEYLAIPRAGGEYTIPAVQFSYFDVNEGKYKTLSTDEYTLHIARAANETDPATAATVQQYASVKEDIRQLGSDIRYIQTGNLRTTTDKGGVKFGSFVFWMLYLVPFVLAVVLLIVFRKKIRENADQARMRYKKANKVAQKRLKAAKALLAENNKTAFYEEIERAAWQYLSDRLSIPTAELNKENITSILQSKNVSEQLIGQVHSVLTTAEFARYAPAASDHAMEDMYNETTQLINNLENQKL